MFEFFAGLTDDQKAFLGCAAALMLSGGIMSLSIYLRKLRADQSTDKVALRVIHNNGHLSEKRTSENEFDLHQNAA